MVREVRRLISGRNPCRRGARAGGPAGEDRGRASGGAEGVGEAWRERCARHDWDEVVQDCREVLKISPDDARRWERLRHALDRRARVREATAASRLASSPG
jgi:hypothetical protein